MYKFTAAILLLPLSIIQSQELNIQPIATGEGIELEVHSKTVEQSKNISIKFLSDRVYADKIISKIAFGSCNKPNKKQEFWDVIRAKEPDVMLLLGDNHYAESTDPVHLKKAYDNLATIVEYSAFRQKIPVFATWDNHDYGSKYLGRAHPNADQSEQLFLDHFSVDKTDARSLRRGIYGTWIFGDKPHRVQIIMLDLHRFKDPIKKGQKFEAQLGMTLVGDDQWKWFEEQLDKEAEIRIIGSGIQVLSNEHLWRRWGMFPEEHERLLHVINKAKGTTVLLSGDRHRGEISVLNPSGKRPLLDVTASSFNLCYPGKEKNSLRVGNLIYEPHFGWLEIDWEQGSISTQLLSSDNATSLHKQDVKISD